MRSLVSMLAAAVFLRDVRVRRCAAGWRVWDWAFMLDRGKPLRDAWGLIPDNTDVLITHGPPQGVGDTSCIGGSNVGCRDLLDRIDELRLKAHIFGHIHEGYGSYQRDDTTLINASTCTERYEPTNPPVIFELG